MGSISRGYLVMRWVTSRMHSGCPVAWSDALRLHFCNHTTGIDLCTYQVLEKQCTEWATNIVYCVICLSVMSSKITKKQSCMSQSMSLICPPCHSQVTLNTDLDEGLELPVLLEDVLVELDSLIVAAAETLLRLPSYAVPSLPQTKITEHNIFYKTSWQSLQEILCNQ